MLVEHILRQSIISYDQCNILNTQCSEFLHESQGRPLYKLLPRNYNAFHKVKVRLKKGKVSLPEQALDDAFEFEYNKLSQRAVFAYSEPIVQTNEQNMFYIFPINGYRYLYSKEVKNLSTDHKTVIDTLFENFTDPTEASNIVTDLLTYTYCSSNLSEGISAGAEIIFYGIAQFYAVRADVCTSYNELILSL